MRPRSVLLRAFVSLAVVFGAAQALAAPKPKSALKDVKIPEGKHFIDTIGTYVPPADGKDLQLRFVPGDPLPPSPDAEVLSSPDLDPWYLNIKSYLNEHTEAYQAYTGAPAPALNSIPFYITRDNALNCVVVRRAEDGLGKTENKSLLGFLAQTPDAKSTPRVGEVTQGDAPPVDDKPARVELHCTDTALQNIGKVSTLTGAGDSEISFLIAHELSHVLLGHFAAYDVKAKRQKQLGDFFKTSVTIWSLASSKYTRSGNTIYVQGTKRTTKGITALMLATTIVDELNITVFGPKWEREQETQADLLAIDLIKMRGGEITGGTTMLRHFATVAEKQKETETPFIETMFKTLSLAALNDAANGQSSKNIINGLIGKASIMAYLKWRETSIGSTHLNFDRRVAMMQEYDEDFYCARNDHAAVPRYQEDGKGNLVFDAEGRPIPITSPATALPQEGKCKPAAAAPQGPFPDVGRLYGVSLWSGDSFQKAAEPEVRASELQREMIGLNCQTLAAPITDAAKPPFSPETQSYIVEAQKKSRRLQVEDFAIGTYHMCYSEGLDDPTASVETAIRFLKAAADGPVKKTPYFLRLIQAQDQLDLYPDVLSTAEAADKAGLPRRDYLTYRITALMGLQREAEANSLALDCRNNEAAELGIECMRSVGKTFDGQPLPPSPNSEATSSQSAIGFLKNLTGSSATPKEPPPKTESPAPKP